MEGATERIHVWRVKGRKAINVVWEGKRRGERPKGETDSVEPGLSV